MYLKNTGSQKLEVFAFDYTTGAPKTGDAANITAYVNIDEAGYGTLTDTSATEVDSTNKKGLYLFDLTQGETNGTKLGFFAKSSTANVFVQVRLPGGVSFTQPATGILAPATAGRTLVVDASGLADANTVKVGPTGSGTAQTARDLGTSVLLSVGTGTGQVNLSSGKVPATLASTDVTGNVAADVQTVKTQTVTCSAGVTISPFVGSTGAAINGTNANTLSSHDPGATLGTGTSTLTQTQVTGGAYALNSASFSFNSGLDLTTTQKTSVRSSVGLATANLDTQLATLSTLDAAGVRDAVGMASADLDTQLGDILTNTTDALTGIGSIQAVFPSNFAVLGINASGHISRVTLADDVTTKTGYRLSATGVDDIWDEVQSGHSTSGTFGKYVDAAISGVSTGGVSAADIADAVWDEARSGHTTSGTFGQGVATVQGNVTGSVGSISGVSFPTNFSLLSIDTNGAINFGTIPFDQSNFNDFCALDIPTSNNLGTLGDALMAAWVQGKGKWAITGGVHLRTYLPDAATVDTHFLLDDADAPTSRTPQ